MSLNLLSRESEPHRSEMLSPLRNANFVLLWIGQSVSSIGNGMYTITLAWVVYSLTHSASNMSIVLIANIIPQLALILFGGVLADRVQRRLVILCTNSAAAIITAGLAYAVDRHILGMPGILTASFALGVTSAFFSPAFSSIFKDILTPEQRISGNSLRGMSSNAVRLVSPAIGGFVYGLGGATLGFGLDSLSFLVAASAVALANVPRRKMQMQGTILGDMRDGVSYIARTNWLRSIVLVSLLINVFCVAPVELLLALVVRDGHHSSAFLGMLLSSQAAFAAVTAWMIGKLGKRIRGGFGFFLLTGVMAVGVFVTGVAASIWVLLFVGTALIGIGFGCNVLEDILMQSCVPDEILGRVYSIGVLTSYALLPVGYIFAGAGTKYLGGSGVLVLGGVCGVVSCVALYAWSHGSLEIASRSKTSAEPGLNKAGRA